MLHAGVEVLRTKQYGDECFEVVTVPYVFVCMGLLNVYRVPLLVICTLLFMHTNSVVNLLSHVFVVALANRSLSNCYAQA